MTPGARPHLRLQRVHAAGVGEQEGWCRPAWTGVRTRPCIICKRLLSCSQKPTQHVAGGVPLDQNAVRPGLAKYQA